MPKKAPNQKILEAFNVSGKPLLIPGGQDTCYRVGDVVFKPTKNVIEASWLAEINSGLKSPKFRVSKPRQTKNGLWVFDGWTASAFLLGKPRTGNYAEAIKLSKIFHKELVGVLKPDWFDKKTDVFSLADKMAWGELPLPDFKLSNKPLKRIFNFLQKNRLPNQLIHGDWGPEQILCQKTLPPAIIDMTPYFRPANYPIADMIVSALANNNVKATIINLGKNIKDFDQLLLRALVFRTCTYVGFQIHPENNRDWTTEINRHLNLFAMIMKEIGKIKNSIVL